MAQLPTSHDSKLAYLLAAAKHGKAINKMLKVGVSAAGLRDYVEQAKELSLTETDENRIILRFGDLVNWVVTLDQNDAIQGYGFSGYGDLMEELGIDFAGAPYQG